MATATHLGCPRLGSQRELKWSLEKYWRGTANAEALHRLGRDLRQALQQRLNLPLFPTTTIGSFPQTPEVRQARSQCKAGKLDAVAYEAFLKQEIACAIRVQEEIGLDVLVHGKFERNDMVEYFGE